MHSVATLAITRLHVLTQRRNRLLKDLADVDGERRVLIDQALREGHGVRAVGQAAGVSHSRISQIAREGRAA
jgi:hypothetical protein